MDIHKVEALPELVARAQAEREELDYGTVRPFVIELANRGRVRAEEWAVAMNTYERELLVPHLETEVFLQQVQHCLLNCERKDGPSYDAALQNRYMPDALRRIQELSDALLVQQGHWEGALTDKEELLGKLQASRAEVARLTSLLTYVVNWCTDKPEDDKPGPFKKDTYKDGLRYAKHTLRSRVLGRLDPAVQNGERSFEDVNRSVRGCEPEVSCQGCGASGREKHLAGCPTVGEPSRSVSEVTNG